VLTARSRHKIAFDPSSATPRIPPIMTASMLNWSDRTWTVIGMTEDLVESGSGAQSHPWN
jgi:hypothetical protein